jgi:hypothetical protein
VREDSPRLSEGDEAVFVEFLDFECEAMYHRLVDPAEQERGHQEASLRETFFGYAEDLALDMEQFATTYDEHSDRFRHGPVRRCRVRSAVLGLLSHPHLTHLQMCIRSTAR